MKYPKIIMAAALFFSIAIYLGCAPKEQGKTEEKISRPLEYGGYTFPEYQGFKKFSKYVEMSDGVKLAVDIYLPEDGPARESFPVTFQYLPYTRAFIDLKDGPGRSTLRKMFFNNPGPVMDHSTDKIARALLSHGYAFVIADMRGTGASYGHKIDFMPQIADDGGELVEWIASQPWCDGNVGMFGGSYLGYSQVVTAGKAPSALKCICPMVVPLDGFHGEVYPGGIYLWGFMEAYSEGLERLNLNYFNISPLKLLFGLGMDGFSLPAAPVVDEDGDGELADEIPIDLNGNGTFLDDYNYPDDPSDPPQYSDNGKRNHIYYMATYDHKKNLNYHSWAQNAMFIDGETPQGYEDLTSYDLSPSAHVQSIMKKGIAIYNFGGWFDTFPRGTAELFRTMQKTNPSKMTIAPMYHSGGGPFWKYLGEDASDLQLKLAAELIRFFDRYLKGIQNGIDTEPPVFIYVMNGDGWRFENEWPLARRVPTNFYFNKDNELSNALQDEGRDEYPADFTHDSRYGTNDGNRFMGAMGIVPDKLPIRTDKDKKCLHYTSWPMSEPVEVTGHPIVRMWVSSTAEYGDFFVYLEDVAPNGQVLLITEGMLRAGFANLYDNDLIIHSGKTGIDVVPDLPWHGYEKKHYTDKILAGNKVVELVFDLKPTSWVFRKGHKIRISIACADWPTFRLHPKLAPNNKPGDPENNVPTVTIYRDAERPSGVMLPIIPKL